jgi:hypothetical protein
VQALSTAEVVRTGRRADQSGVLVPAIRARAEGQMSPTIWVIVATLYMPDGAKKQYRPEVEFPDSTSCFTAADKIARDWLAEHKGWAMCVPKDYNGK